MNTQAGLPEALASRQRRITVSDDLAGSSGRGPHISIRGKIFRLVNAQGEERIIDDRHLDVVVIRANPKMGKLYYRAWEPNNPLPPTCFSDNGVGPSINAMEPQSPLCVSCQWNQKNSKINPETGKGSKACKDVQKLAVIIPGDPAVNVYELSVPPDSQGALRAYRDFLRQQASGGQRKVDMSDMVTRLTFDLDTAHPKIKFEPSGWADDQYTMDLIDYIYDNQLDRAAACLDDQAADPETVKQSIELRAQYAQLAPQRANQPAQLQPPLPSNGQAPSQEAPKPRGRPRKPQQEAPQQVSVPSVFSPPTPATPVAPAPGMPDIPEFLRRPAANTAPPVSPTPPAQPQPAITPQYGMAAAPPPPPQVTEALHAAMRMPPRR